MKYDLSKLNPWDFEHLVQSLTKKILGTGATSFGDGTDGGREASFKGKAPYPSSEECWEGYWVIQAKYKLANDTEDGFIWIKNRLTEELEKYSSRKIQVEYPENYLLFTNVTLTARPSQGGRDKASSLEQEYQTKYGINNIRIISNDDIRDFLDDSRDIAISYAPFILAGDILSSLMDILVVTDKRADNINEIINRFLEVEFREDIQSKLDHAGKVTSDKINLEKVFIDLYATADGTYSDNPKFINYVLTKGNSIRKGRPEIENRIVLIAGPGYGKSTLTQYLTQICRTNFLISKHNGLNIMDEVQFFIEDSKKTIPISQKWIRFPIRIILKEYAGWVKDRTLNDPSAIITVLEYIKSNINRKGEGDLSSEELSQFLVRLPCLFVFDGLDEVPVSSNRREVLEQIDNFTNIVLRRLGADYLIVATTRPQGYSKEFDTSRYEHLQVADLDEVVCKEYLSKLMTVLISDSTERNSKLNILTSALNDSEVSRLMKSPLQASIMAILVNSGGEPPRNKYDLFTDYYNIIFKREKQRNITKILSEHPDYIKDIHNELGYYLQLVSEKSTNPSANIDIKEFKRIIRDYLLSWEVELSTIDSLTDEIINAATDRLVFISEVEDNKIGFAIRSLQEYFAANGYIDNVSEDVVHKKIRAISRNSYWSNTLLFAIGSLSKTRQHLVDFIESLCGELNGSEDDFDHKSLTSIVKAGSWLALDILNEGIFRGKPRIENKFLRLLEPLFTISFTTKHYEITRLPNKLLENSIIGYVENELSKEPLNITAWKIAIGLHVKDSESLSLIKKKWPINLENQIQVLDLIINENVFDLFAVDLFIKLIEDISKNKILKLFERHEKRGFLKLVCSAKLPFSAKAIMIEIAFVCSIKHYTQARVGELFNLLSFSHEEKLDKIIAADVFDIELVEGFAYRLARTKIESNQLIVQFREFANEFGETFSVYFIDFLLNPTYDAYANLDKYIELQETTYKNSLRGILSYFNSFFGYIHAQKVEIDKEEFDNLLDTIENFELDEIEADNNLLLNTVAYSCGNSLNMNNFYKRIKEYEIKFDILTTTNVNAINEFFTLVSWSNNSFENEELISLKNDIELKTAIFKVLKDHLTSTSQISYIEQANYLYYFSLAEIYELYKNNTQDQEIHIISTVYFQNMNNPIFEEVYEKICSLIKLQCLQNENVQIKLLLQIILLVLNSFHKIDIEHLPFIEMKNLIIGNENDAYKCLILLLKQDFDEIDLADTKEILRRYNNLFQKEDFIKLITYLMKFSPNNEHIDNFIVFINEKVEENFTQSKSEFDAFVKQYIGNKPTDLAVL